MVERKPGHLVQMKVRVPEEVRASLEAAAERRGGSTSAEAADRLKWSLEREELLPHVLSLRFERGPAGIVMAVADVMDIIGRMTVRTLSNNTPADAPETWADDRRCRERALLGGMALLAMMRPRGAGMSQNEAIPALIFTLEFMNDLHKVDHWPDKMPKDYRPMADRDEAKHHYARHRARMQGIRDLLGPYMADELRPQNLSDVLNAFRSIAQLVEDVQHQNEGLFATEHGAVADTEVIPGAKRTSQGRKP